jgi:hypothetical protein
MAGCRADLFSGTKSHPRRAVAALYLEFHVTSLDHHATLGGTLMPTEIASPRSAEFEVFPAG